MKRFLILTALLPLVAGCAAKDLKAASARAHKAVQVGVLPAADPLPGCLDYLIGSSANLSSVLGAPAGVVDEAVKLYILDAQYQSHAELDLKCGPVAITILRNVGKKLAPFGGALPGF